MEVFVYGTLTDPNRVAEVVDAFTFGPDATLVGCHRVDGAYPTLAPGDETTGRVLRTPNVGALDAYEGVDRGLYVRTSVPGPTGPCALYVGDPERLDAEATWPGDGPFDERVDRYLREHDVRVRTAADRPADTVEH
ncbi:gamma-glutamylcyclotransferase family protein [Halomarina oriensis]|uniref:Gamma-glutamylcyclotransferase n=1 Tax=Halomarina oriensis TaxID=671145 RepID=A0A6B0GN22_9EURY|nr:gamma-glutamylcyclotransferase family protein [Halomarina oriensis]MWG34889.1 gamma-glutamylcyclotransferase [Halomarina oriensis]